jgi:hypothetical protein
MKTFRQFFIENQKKYVILLPGGYKPPTKGHMHMIKSYNDNSLVSKVIVLIGPKEREGFTKRNSLKVFNLYGIDSLAKVTIEDTNIDNPMVAGFDFVEKDPRAVQYKGMIIGFGASNKGSDAERAEKLVKYFDKNPDRLREGLQVGIPPIVTALKAEDNEPVSATNLRLAIKAGDIKKISKLIPDNVHAEDFLKIFNK